VDPSGSPVNFGYGSQGHIPHDRVAMEPDPQELLPPDLRRTWAVVPRDTLNQVCLVGAIMGAGTALWIATLIAGSGPMYYGFQSGGSGQARRWLGSRIPACGSPSLSFTSRGSLL
jgi:hypothetical protein